LKDTSIECQVVLVGRAHQGGEMTCVTGTAGTETMVQPYTHQPHGGGSERQSVIGGFLSLAASVELIEVDELVDGCHIVAEVQHDVGRVSEARE
jgi:hypothetical protein